MSQNSTPSSSSPSAVSADSTAAKEEIKVDSRTVNWVMTTNFAEGLPFMIVRIVSTVFYTDIGLRERYLGYLNILAGAWNLKFLWAPFVDIFSTKRRWIVALQAAIASLIMLVALICYTIPAEGDPTRYLAFIAIIFVGMAFLSATNDIAIDAYYLEGIPNKADQAAYSGFRILAYRLAMVFARSGLVALAAIMGSVLGGTNKYLPWVYAFAAGGLMMFALAIVHSLMLKDFYPKQTTTTAKEKLHAYGQAFASYLKQDRVALVIIFIIIYKIGDEILFSMVTPFLLREIGLTKGQLSWLGGFVGAAGTIIGAMIGGWWIKQWGLKRAIWPLTLLMNFNIWAYIWLAWAKPNPQTTSGITLIAVIHGYEQIAAGLGSTALTVFIMRTCNPNFRAAHYAIGSAIMSLCATLIGSFGGVIVENIGYLNLFIIAFFASIPSMLMLFVVPIQDDAPTIPTTK
jgi:MFS transporter, PAT family, beta-lactamase induction signal transducer AmpG